MKKLFVALLAAALVFSLCGCAKSEAVTNVETLISQLGTIHLEDSEKVAQAREAYDALTEEEAAQVENAALLLSAENRLMELVLMGDWAFTPEEYRDIPEMYDVVDLTLWDDMTVSGGAITGTWYVDGDQLRIDNGETISSYEILFEEEQLRLAFGQDKVLIRTDDMNAKLDDMFTFVELTAENIDIYCDILWFTEDVVDKFGTPTGEYTTRITFGSNAIDDGLMYFGNEDVVVELLIPEHTYTRSKATKNFKYTQEAGTCELSGCLYGADGYAAEFFDEEGYLISHKVNSVSIGRVKGTLILVNSAYVSAVEEDDGQRYLVMDNGSRVHTGRWFDNLEF